MKMLDLFSGIGGFSLAARWTGRIETVAFCEIDAYCQKVLAKNFPGVPIHSDIRTLKGSDVGPVDLVCGGFPCQPFSVAGKQRGADDDRHLWPEMLRVIEECKPSWVVGENVAGFIPMGLDNVLSDLEGVGYEGQAFVIPACAVDAPHRRDRVWVIAHSKSRPRDVDASVHGDGLVEAQEVSGNGNRVYDGGGRWISEPGVCRVVDGLSEGMVSQLRSLGNSIVPQVAYEILTAVLAADGRA